MVALVPCKSLDYRPVFVVCENDLYCAVGDDLCCRLNCCALCCCCGLNIVPACNCVQAAVLTAVEIPTLVGLKFDVNSLLLNMCYLGLLGIIMFLGNLNARLPAGSLVIVGIHLTGMLVMSDFVPLFKPSLVAHAMFQYHLPRYGPLSISESYLVFGALFLCAFWVLHILSRHIDYNVAVSQKTW